MYNLTCWNALSDAQQQRLIHHGNLPLGYVPEGRQCRRGAEVGVECEDDRTPTARFYCYPCAIAYLTEKRDEKLTQTRARISGKIQELSGTPDMQQGSE